MSTLNVSLPVSLKDFVDDRVRKDGYSTSREYVRELIRADQVLRAERELAALPRTGLASDMVLQTLCEGFSLIAPDSS